MDDKIRVFCPSCRTILEVPTVFSENNTRFSCPQCGFNAPFNSYGRLNAGMLSSEASFGHADSTIASNDGAGATECFADCKCEEGVLVRCNDGKAISLPMGLNSIGRGRLKAKTFLISIFMLPFLCLQTMTRYSFPFFSNTNAVLPILNSSPKFKTTFIPLSNLFPLTYDAFFASVS